MAGYVRREIYKGVPDKGRYLKKDQMLPNLRKGLSMVSFAPGIREYRFATPAMLEDGILLTGPGHEYNMSDYICVDSVFEQPGVYKNYIGGTYGRTKPKITQADREEMLRALDTVNTNYAIKDLVMPEDIKKLDSDPEAYSRIWESIYADPEKYRGVRSVLLNAEFRTLRSLTYSIFTDGAVSFEDLDNAFQRTKEKILKLEVSEKTKEAMIKAMDGIRESCVKQADPVSHMVFTKQYNNIIADMANRKELGAEKGLFTDLLSKEINELQWRKAIPETTYFHKDMLRDYFDEMNENVPDEIVKVNELVYKTLNDYIERESRQIHSYDNPYIKHSDDQLDELEGDDSPVPMRIIYSMTVSDEASNRHEANIIVSDGEKCSFEKISMDTDGTISSARANVGLNGVIADLGAAVEKDLYFDRQEFVHKEEKELQTVSHTLTEGSGAGERKVDITERIAIAEEEFFDEI